MQKITNVGILGAGAIGAFFAGRFSDTPGFSCTLIAREPRLSNLCRGGLYINNRHYLIPVVDPDRANETLDLIVVALKHHHLADAAHSLDKLVGADTTFVSFMNGLESEEYLAKLYGAEKVLYGISLGIDAQREDNRIAYTKAGRHIFGEARNPTVSERVRRVQEAFERAGIAYETPEDMIRTLWWKFMINVGTNLASAVMRAPYGVFHTSPEAQALMEALMGEVLLLAEAENVNLSEEDVRNWYPVLSTLSPQGKTSMLQDIEAGRKSEVEIFAGRVVALGEKHGISTPVNRTVLQIIQVLEEQAALQVSAMMR